MQPLSFTAQMRNICLVFKCYRIMPVLAFPFPMDCTLYGLLRPDLPLKKGRIGAETTLFLLEECDRRLHRRSRGCDRNRSGVNLPRILRSKLAAPNPSARFAGSLLDQLQVNGNPHSIYQDDALIDQVLSRNLVLDERVNRVKRADVVDRFAR